MKIVLLLCSLFVVGLCYDPHITRQDYGDCVTAVRVTGDKNSQYNFTNFLEISKLKYNYNNKDELLRARMYFKGKSEFSALLSGSKTPTNSDKVFPSCKWIFLAKSLKSKIIFLSVIAYGNKNQESAIFFEKLEDPNSTMKCNHVANIDNMFNESHFEILDILINKKGKSSHACILW